MKNLFPHLFMIAAGIVSAVSVNAQTAPSTRGKTENIAAERWTCGQQEYENSLRAQDPDYDKKREEAEKVIQANIAKMKLNSSQSAAAVYTIPVVVHVVYNTAAQNISDAVIIAAINNVNKDLRRQNTDASSTPAVWQPIAADVEIELCLAAKDPNGNATTGITHTSTAASSFAISGNPVKHASSGGVDAWDVTKYYNIWICNITGNTGGYAPQIGTGAPWSEYGAVADYCAFAGCAPSGFNGHRSLLHEVGHTLNLYHIWGDDNGACTGSDQVADTPNQGNTTLATTSAPYCPTFPKTDACSPSSPGIMFMNYMDYTNTTCQNLFTAGQKARMQAAVTGSLMGLVNNNTVCNVAPPIAVDASVSAIVSPAGTLCGATVNPIVTLKNYGANTLTSCIINYSIDANPNQTYNWTGSLAQSAQVNVSLASMTTTAGAHTFTAFTSNPNATTDGNTANDQSSGAFTVMVSGAAQNLPVAEGMENSVFPPAGWTRSNPDDSITWERTTAAAKTGSASMWFNSINYSCNGCIDILQTPALNLSSVSSPQVTFQVAYRMLSDPSITPNWSDSLRVDISTNCGVTWTNLYFKYSTNLATITPSFSTTPFVPGPNDWRMETISLASYASNNNVLLRWKVSSDYENNLYVDDINISGMVGINEYDLDDYVSVFPNPSNGFLYVNLSAFGLGQVDIKLYNLVGEVIGQISESITSPQKIKFNLNDHPNGIYFVEVKTNKGSAAKKLILNK